MCLCPKPVVKHQDVLPRCHCNSERLDTPPLHFTEKETEARGLGGGVCLTAGKGEVRIPDIDGSDSLSSSQPLCVLQRLALSWHQACLFGAWPGEIRALPALHRVELHSGVSRGSLPNKSLLRMRSKQGSVGPATPLSGASGWNGQRETSKLRSLAV